MNTPPASTTGPTYEFQTLIPVASKGLGEPAAHRPIRSSPDQSDVGPSAQQGPLQDLVGVGLPQGRVTQENHLVSGRCAGAGGQGRGRRTPGFSLFWRDKGRVSCCKRMVVATVHCLQGHLETCCHARLPAKPPSWFSPGRLSPNHNTQAGTDHPLMWPPLKTPRRPTP